MTYEQLMQARQAAIAAGLAAPDAMQFPVGDPRDRVFAAIDPQTGAITLAQGDARSGGIQRYTVTPQGTTDLGFEPIDFAANRRRDILGGLALAGTVAGLGAVAPSLGLAPAASSAAPAAAGGTLSELVAAQGLPALSGVEPIATGAAGLAPSGMEAAYTAADLLPGGTNAAAGATAGAATASGLPAVAPAASGVSSLWGVSPETAAIIAGTGVSAIASNRAAGIQADAARGAADSTLQATRETNDLIRGIDERNRADFAPWRQAGMTALGQLTSGTQPGGQFDQRFDASRMYDDPGYQFRLAEGEKALSRAAAAGGRFDSGRSLRELTRYGQDYASGEYGNAYNRFRTDQSDRFGRLSSLAGLGSSATQSAAAGSAGAGAQMAGNTMAGTGAANNALMGGSAARASGYVGGANAINAGIGTYMQNQQSTRLMDLISRRPSLA